MYNLEKTNTKKTQFIKVSIILSYYYCNAFFATGDVNTLFSRNNTQSQCLNDFINIILYLVEGTTLMQTSILPIAIARNSLNHFPHSILLYLQKYCITSLLQRMCRVIQLIYVVIMLYQCLLQV